MWVDKCSELYSSSMKSWLQDYDIEMYSTHNEGKSVVAQRFIRTLKNKITKYMTSISKMCISINKLMQLINTIRLIIAQSKLSLLIQILALTLALA